MDKINPAETADPAAHDLGLCAVPKRRSFFFQQADQPVWSYRWFHWALGIGISLMVCSFVLPPVARVMQLAEPILVPILAGLMLAYIFNPVVSFLHRRLRIPRPATAASILVSGALVAGVVAVFLLPTVANQASRMAEDVPGKLEALAQRLSQGDFPKLRDTREIQHWLTEMAERIRSGEISIAPYLGQAGKALGAGWSLVSGVLGMAAYGVLCGIVTSACFFFFSWHFPAIVAWPKPFIPVEYQKEVLRIATLCDRAVSAFIRGRLIQALIFGTILTVGWGIAGVPYFYLLGVAGGMLALLPYLSITSLPVAVALVWFDHLAPESAPIAWYHLATPAGVYFFAYALDSFMVEPLVQGKATGLSPLAVLLAVLLGGATAGILGVILAIPTAACALIIWREALLPRLKELAGGK